MAAHRLRALNTWAYGGAQPPGGLQGDLAPGAAAPSAAAAPQERRHGESWTWARKVRGVPTQKGQIDHLLVSDQLEGQAKPLNELLIESDRKQMYGYIERRSNATGHELQRT